MQRHNENVGDVIIKEEDLPYNVWKLARVVKPCEVDDALVRKVTLHWRAKVRKNG